MGFFSSAGVCAYGTELSRGPGRSLGLKDLMPGPLAFLTDPETPLFVKCVGGTSAGVLFSLLQTFAENRRQRRGQKKVAATEPEAKAPAPQDSTTGEVPRLLGESPKAQQETPAAGEGSPRAQAALPLGDTPPFRAASRTVPPPWASRAGWDRRPAATSSKPKSSSQGRTAAAGSRQPSGARPALQQSEAARAARCVTSILNKLTRETFDKLYLQLMRSCSSSEVSGEVIERVACEVFSAATMKHAPVELYAELCARFHTDLRERQEGLEVRFKRSLLGQCQRSFDRHLEPPKIDDSLGEEEQFEELVKYKTKMLGNVRLVGHLLRQKMLAPTIIFHCADALLEGSSAERLETICAFLEVLGDMFDTPDWRGRAKLEEVFERLQQLSRPMSGQKPRIRFMLTDLLDKRRSGWGEKHQGSPPSGAVRKTNSASESRPAAGRRPVPAPRGDSSLSTLEVPPKLSSASGASPATARSDVHDHARRARGGVRQAKHLCRYLVGIEEEKDFQVCGRLIGPAGEHMKRIVAEAPDAKIRIRGRGSKYREGPSNVESTDPLMLCVSAASAKSFETATKLVEDLLRAVQEDYRRFCRNHDLAAPVLFVRREKQQQPQLHPQPSQQQPELPA